MQVPEVSIINTEDQIVFKAKFADDDVMEHKLSNQEYEEMCQSLGIWSMDELGHRFGEVCKYFLRKDQYVEFEEVKDEPKIKNQ